MMPDTFSMSTAEPIVINALHHRETALAVRFQDVLSQSECVISDEHIRNFHCSSRKWFQWWKTQLVSVHRLCKCASIEHTTIRKSSIATDINVQQFVLCVCNSHQYYAVCAFVIIENTTSTRWSYHCYMFSIDCSDAVGELPKFIEFMGNSFPSSWCSRRLQ